jgi:hypothetical protein
VSRLPFRSCGMEFNFRMGGRGSGLMGYFSLPEGHSLPAQKPVHRLFGDSENRPVSHPLGHHELIGSVCYGSPFRGLRLQFISESLFAGRLSLQARRRATIRTNHFPLAVFNFVLAIADAAEGFHRP